MSLGSIRSMVWLGERLAERAATVKSQSDSKGSDNETVENMSDFAFGIGPDQISVSTIVEKLVSERLKLGIVKTAKGAEQIIHQSVAPEVEKEARESSEETIPSLSLCLEKFETRAGKIRKEIDTDDYDPEENPPNVIEPDFSEPESEVEEDYVDPRKDIHMMLNRSRSFYTPTGFKDSRSDLKKLENERERMWLQTGRDKYTILLYEEALKPMKNIIIKGRIYEDDELDLGISKEDLVIKSLESIMAFVKPKELPPEEWDPGYLATVKYPPYWAYAPATATDKTINKIRYIHKTLRETDFHRQDPKLRRRTGRKMYSRATEEVDESEESVLTQSEEESSEDEPYMLKRRDSVFIKKKVTEVEEEEEEEQPLEIKPGKHNIQVGHEISISTIQKQFPDSDDSLKSDDDEPSISYTVSMTTSAYSSTIGPDDVYSRSTTLETVTTGRSKYFKSSFLKRDELDDVTSEESLYDTTKKEKEEHKEKDDEEKPAISMHHGYPYIRQRPKWKTLQRECLEKPDEDQSHVERYRCLCLSRGIPPLESVARNIKKKSVVLNRMGRGPEDTIQTMTEVLGKQTKTLDLTGVYLSNNDVCHLGKAIPNFIHLTKLRLPRTQLNGEKFTSLAPTLSECQELCLLDVSYNAIRKITPALAKSLQLIMTLSSLNLSHCQLANDSFSGLIQLPGSLRSLDISWNRLNDPTGLKNLYTSLMKNHSQLRELRMSWNSISGIDSVKTLTDIAKYLKTLVYLDLSYNGFNSPDEMLLFKSMLEECRKLKCFFLAGNPLGEGAAEALLSELEWQYRPSLRLLDLGDLWIDKDIYQICKHLKAVYHVETRIGGIKGNINLLELDMREPLLRRLHHLNTSKKKKKTLKDLGNAILKLMDREETTRVRSGKLRQFILDEKFKVEEGLPEALTKALADRHRIIDLRAAHAKYRELYPEEIKEPKKKKPKKKIPDEEIPIVELMEPRLATTKSSTNLLFVQASRPSKLHH